MMKTLGRGALGLVAVGDKYMSTYSDGYGGTTGTIGNKRISSNLIGCSTRQIGRLCTLNVVGPLTSVEWLFGVGAASGPSTIGAAMRSVILYAGGN
jgi:hypothetical protein